MTVAISKRVLRSYLANSNKGQVRLETETTAVLPQRQWNLDRGRILLRRGLRMVYCYSDGSIVLREDDGNGGDTLRALSAKEARTE